MSYQPPNLPAFLASEHYRRFEIDELDTVTLNLDVETDLGERVPAGTAGTVMAVWGEAEAFEVEFDDPIKGLARIVRSMIHTFEQLR